MAFCVYICIIQIELTFLRLISLVIGCNGYDCQVSPNISERLQTLFSRLEEKDKPWYDTRTYIVIMTQIELVKSNNRSIVNLSLNKRILGSLVMVYLQSRLIKL